MRGSSSQWIIALVCAGLFIFFLFDFSVSKNDSHDQSEISGRFLKTLSDTQTMSIARKADVDQNIQVMDLKGTNDDTVFRIPDDITLKGMSQNVLQWMYQTYIKSPQATCSAVVKFGRTADGGGGYELCNDPRFRIDSGSCLVYSFGINNDFSFDDGMEAYGCEVHSFDPSMAKESHLRGRRVHFHNTGVGGADASIPRPKAGADMSRRKAGNWQVYTIESHRRLNSHSVGQRRLDVLKIDVEGYEWEALTSALENGALDDVRQIMMETHMIGCLKVAPTQSEYASYLRVWRLLFERGFRIYFTSPGRCFREFSLVNVNHINSNWKELTQQQHEDFYKYSHNEKATLF